MTRKSTAKKKSAKQTAPIGQDEAVGIRLAGIGIVAFTVTAASGDISNKSLSIQTKLEFGGEPNQGIFVVNYIIAAEILPAVPDEVNKESAFNLITQSVFSISNIDQLEIGEDGTPKVPNWITATMVSVAVGSTRGILIERLANTQYSEVLLPIQSLHKLTPEGARYPESAHGV